MSATAATIFWDDAIDHSIVRAIAQPPPSSAAASFDLRTLRQYASVLQDESRERLCLSDGYHRIALTLTDGTFLDGPVTLSFVVESARSTAQIATVTRFQALRARHAFGSWLHRPERGAQKWIRQLRVFDALAVGVGEREIADALFGNSRSFQQWTDGSTRSVVRRLGRAARAMVNGGYLALLKGA